MIGLAFITAFSLLLLFVKLILYSSKNKDTWNIITEKLYYYMHKIINILYFINIYNKLQIIILNIIS